ncbi:Ras and Rab interactor 3 [Homo sapiens]|uniref:Ras and Rab interactor 3 n=1 Tax=Homo sapiens TaxID=9606 RepID=G3V2I7_HUMAN|nr:Ras and Rab interactor 3, isoform CRA_e [Homo sapiens]KAI2572505.1 Ras and Rab interactor 3 [Homo sapiens]KAI4062129.1 Ras and Rab interactor 3 [Homo sapiens]
MIRHAGAPARGDPTGPVPVVGKGEEEEEEDGMRLCLPANPKNCLPHRRGISILEKLIKTCPVWLQLSLGQAEVARILHRVVAGMFLVRRDSSSKQLVLCVHFPSLNESSAEVLEYTIKEEKSKTYCPSHCGYPRPSLRPAASRTLRPSPTWVWVSGTPR